MKKLIDKFMKLSRLKKAQLIIAVLLTVAVIISIPAYAWFSNQRKAAEMYKIEYPNSLYINAAHREDRMYFNLDGVEIGEYLRDENKEIMLDDVTGEPIYITEKYYVFTVSGSNATKFILQMAHTNNNLFNYTIYSAQQYEYRDSEAAPAGTAAEKIVPAGTEESSIIEYKTHPSGYTENPLVFASDPVNRSAVETKYYVIGNLISGSYLNNQDNTLAISPDNLAKNNDSFYDENFGDNNKVESHAIPSYWQATVNSDYDANKMFSKYFVLKVSWNPTVQATNRSKESDIIYFSVKRTN